MIKHISHQVITSKNNVSLTTWKKEDIWDYAELIKDPLVMRYIGNGSTRTVQAAAQEITKFSREIETQGWSRYAIRNEINGDFVGYSGFKQTEMGIDYGGRIIQKYWGSPFAFTGIYLSMEYAFEVLGFDYMYGITHVENVRTIKLMKKFFQLPESAGKVIQTQYGPHLKLDYTPALFKKVKGRNLQIIKKIGRRMQQQALITANFK